VCAGETVRIEILFDRAQRAAQKVSLALGVDDDVVVVGADPLDRVHWHDDGTYAMRNQDTLHVRLWHNCRCERRCKVISCK